MRKTVTSVLSTCVGLPGPTTCVLNYHSIHPAERIQTSWKPQDCSCWNSGHWSEPAVPSLRHGLSWDHSTACSVVRKTLSCTLPRLHPSADGSTCYKAHLNSLRGERGHRHVRAGLLTAVYRRGLCFWLAGTGRASSQISHKDLTRGQGSAKAGHRLPQTMA